MKVKVKNLPTIKLNKNNLFYNLDIITQKTKDINKVSVVLKDNAYGHGLIEMATLTSQYGIKKAVVRDLREATIIKDYFSEILVLAQRDFQELKHSYSHTFHIVINSMEDLEKLPQNIKVHIKVNTGMNRNGIAQNELEECIKGLLAKNISICGIMTHFKNADTLASEYFVQKQHFFSIKKLTLQLCEELSIPLPNFHSCNSAGLFRGEDFTEDMARVGIAMYGYLDNDEVLDFPKLKPVLSLWANKISTRFLNEDESVGYGATFTADKKMIISTYDLGYGNGFTRINENQEYFTKDGYRVLGRVSMDNLSLDTDKEKVCIFDDANNLAKIHNTINYEIITSLSPFIKKVIE